MMKSHDGPAQAGYYRSLALIVMVLTAACGQAEPVYNPDTIIALERGALDRWGKGDPAGYFDIMAPDVTYFDPTTEKRIDGQPDLRKMIEPFEGKIHIDRVEILNPAVQFGGRMAVLTSNIVSRGAQVNGGKKGDVRWNSTEVYRWSDGNWKIVHSHWSYTRPQLKEPAAE